MVFKKNSAKNLAKILAFFVQITASFCKKTYRNIGFWEKRQFFRWKLAKIAENCDHNIDPRPKNFYDFDELSSHICKSIQTGFFDFVDT
jgi:hypothetical protein